MLAVPRSVAICWALAAGCSIELAQLKTPDAGPSSGGSAGLGGADAGGDIDASDDASTDVGDASDGVSAKVACSVDFEGEDCLDGLIPLGNASCGPTSPLSGARSGYLEGGNATSIAQLCGAPPKDLWFELVFERRSSGTVIFRLGGVVAAAGGAQVKVGDGGNVALLECSDGKDNNQFLPAALDTPYVVTLHLDAQGLASLWLRAKDDLTPRGAPHAAMACAPVTKTVGWLAGGGAVTIIDDIRIVDGPSGLAYP